MKRYGVKGDIKACVTIIAIMAIVFSLSPDWQNWVMNSAIGEKLQWLLEIIEQHPILNGIIVLMFSILTFWIIIKWKRDLDYRWYRVLLVFLGLQLIWVMNPMETPLIVGWLNYKWLWTFSLISMLFVFFINQKKSITYLFSHRKNKVESNEQIVKFSLDNIDPDNISESKKKYCDAIVNHLLGTKLGKESFAIGITGAWGTGKTTFLKALARKLEEKAELVWFNPWMCKTPEQVTEDFFITLHKELSSRHSSLSRPIRDYAKYINAGTLSLGGGLLSKIALTLPQESLMSRKKRLSEKFHDLKRPVVVLIDDLDRLERNEVFEVLRLIRNTADLSNVFYIVAYDKAYVTEALKEHKINDAEAYLEKIFPIEVHQPKVEDAQLYKMLNDELSKQHEFGYRFAKKLLGQIDQSERELVIDILNNYRRVKRFTRVYLLNMDYLQVAYHREIKMIDMFWMELLQMYDRKTYDKLADDRDLLLITTGKQYSLKKGIANHYLSEDEEKYAYKGDAFWKPLTPKILSSLFEGRKNLTKYSMRYAENYDKYFTLSVSDYRLSFRDFEDLFNKEKDPLRTVKGWVDGQKYFSSIIYQFESKEAYRLSSEDLGRYVMGLLEFAYLTMNWSDNVIYHVKRLLTCNDYSREQIGWAKGYILGWFNEKITLKGDLTLLSKMLRRIYISTEIDEDGNKREPISLFLSNDDIKTLLRDLMKKFLSHHPELRADSVLNEKGSMGEIFGNCCLCLWDNSLYEEDVEYENVVFDLVIKYFESKEKPTKTVFNNEMSKMFEYEIPDYISPVDYDEYTNSAIERRDSQLTSYFGSDWGKVEEFKSRCFKES